MKQDIAAKETHLYGMKFRSRLEATWAAFFTELEWPWAYEPLVLNYYIPDFILDFKRGPVLVEVKPGDTIPELITLAETKIIRSGWEGEALIVGAHSCIRECEDWGVPSTIGCIGRVPTNKKKMQWYDAILVKCPKCKKMTVVTAGKGPDALVCHLKGCAYKPTTDTVNEAIKKDIRLRARQAKDYRKTHVRIHNEAMPDQVESSPGPIDQMVKHALKTLKGIPPKEFKKFQERHFVPSDTAWFKQVRSGKIVPKGVDEEVRLVEEVSAFSKWRERNERG